MGMYTRLVLNVALKKDMDPGMLATLKKMVEGNAEELPGRLRWMLKSSSYYHDNINQAGLEQDWQGPWKLSVTCDLKNYEDEIDQFLKMIGPFVETHDLAGYVRYEENQMPTLVWFKGGKPVYVVIPEIEESYSAEFEQVCD